MALLVVALLAVFRSWSATGLDASRLAQVLGALTHPELTTRSASQVELQLVIVVGAGSNGPATANSTTGQTLRVLPGSPNPGQTIAFDGSGFAANVDGDLRVVNPSRQIDRTLFTAHTDGSGAFHAETAWPDYATLPPDIYQLHLALAAPSGGPGPSEALLNGLKAIGEIVLIAVVGMLVGFGITRAVARTAWLKTWSIEVALVGVILVALLGMFAAVVVVAAFSLGRELTARTLVQDVTLAALLSLVGAGGIGVLVLQYASQGQFGQAATLVWLALIALVLIALGQRATTIRRSLLAPNGSRS